MREYKQFYVNGEWVEPSSPNDFAVLDPATEEVCATISLGNEADVDKAVAAAKAAFETFSQTSVEERVALLERMAEVYKRRIGEVAEAIRLEMGAPIKLASTAQAYAGLGHIVEAAKVLKTYAFEEDLGPHKVVKEPIGVCGLITPWNWPLNQVSCKVAPAIAVGCTMVLKPSEVAPLSAYLYAEIMHEAGVPAGAVRLVLVLTRKKGQPYLVYIQGIKEEPRAVLPKQADLEDNSDPARLAMLDEATASRLRQKYAQARELLAA